MNEVVVIDQISIEFRDRLTQLEARLDNISDDQLGDAMQWMREQQALLKARKIIGEIVITAKRLEAKMLRRLGKLGVETPDIFKFAQLNGHERSAARTLAEYSETEFSEFVTFLSDQGKVSTDVRMFEQLRDEQIRKQEIYDQAAAGLPPRHRELEIESVRETVNLIVAEILMNNHPQRSSDILVGLADLLDLDADDPIVRGGLNHVLLASLSKVQDDERGTVHFSDGTGSISAAIPVHLAIRYDEWVRIPWRSVTVDQLEWYAEQWEFQADCLERKARNALRLLQIATKLQATNLDATNCDELFTIGRRSGIVRFVEKNKINRAPSTEWFPRLYDLFGGGWGGKNFENLTHDLEEFGYYHEDDLTVQDAKALADKIFTGANVKSMERFAEAYCPELIGTFDRSMNHFKKVDVESLRTLRTNFLMGVQ